ncbi:Nitrous oxide reductase maturation protein NosF (ATPase) [hydrothermal vent metagenome]|uniref:Nitrous oxide reductase maturation protein NosF (ATPase) n=1 Tax=hydrothermal vent metagenome TaxID=652676 RepID=A0A3B1AUS4_9ZZZZ
MVNSDTTANVISLQAVSKQYGNETVLRDINLKVQAGECIVLVGHNGAGKTSLMKLMLGLTQPTSGTVEILGGNPAFSAAVAQRMALGYLPESVVFYEAMTGHEILTFYARLKGSSEVECKDLLELVGLSAAAKKKVGTYSKGMRQRLGLAQAMLGNPQLLFLDEPTTGLDPVLRQHFYELIDGLHKDGTTSVISSHALNEVEARASRFVIMKAGAIVACGTLDALYQQAALPVRLQLSVTPGEAAGVAERLGAEVNIDKMNNQSINLSCLKEEKMPLIRHISSFGEVVHDMQIMPPRLDEIYSHFMNGDPL